MRKIIFAVLAMLAFGALLAATASAEETLLALWLINNNPVTTLTSVETKGSFLLEDTKTIAGAAAFLCTSTFDGSVGENGESETTQILNAKGEKVGAPLVQPALLGTGAGSECVRVSTCAEGSAESPIEVWLVGLPWHSTLFLDAVSGKFLVLFTGTNEMGYELICLVLSIKTEDKCVAPANDFEVEVINDPEDAAIPAGAQTSPHVLCSQSNEETGINEADELASILPLSTSELLSVSE